MKLPAKHLEVVLAKQVPKNNVMKCGGYPTEDICGRAPISGAVLTRSCTGKTGSKAVSYDRVGCDMVTAISEVALYSLIQLSCDFYILSCTGMVHVPLEMGRGELGNFGIYIFLTAFQ